jgi:hypothetical protein
MAGESLIIGDGNWGVKSDSLLGYAVNSGRFVPRDLTFTRATTGTRTNGALLVETTPYNLVQYSEQLDQNIVWVASGITISSNTTISPSGFKNADTIIVTSTSHNLAQSITVIPNNTYTFSFYALRGTMTDLKYSVYNLSGASNIIAPTSYYSQTSSVNWTRVSITFTTPAACTSINIYPLRDSGVTGDFYLWGVQLNEGSSALDYLPTTTRLNIPRVDYSTGTAALLLEPQRTNVMTYSEDFSNAVWSITNGAIATNTITSPSNIISADTFTDDSTSGIHTVIRSAQWSTTQQTFSIYVKANTLTKCYVANGSTGNAVCFDLSNGTIEGYTVGSGNAMVNASITSLSNGWYRVSATHTATASQTFAFGFYKVFNSSSFLSMATYIGTSQSAYIWGAQVEAGAYPTSYIPTTSASVTRNADTMTRSNIYTNNLITSAGGTWIVNLKNNIPITRDGVESGIYIDSLSGGFTNGINIRNAAAASRVSISKWIAGAGAPLYTTTTDNVKIAIKWNGTTADIFENGVKVVSATSFAITNMEFLQAFGNASARKFISSIMLYPTPLSDAECINITK